MEKKSKKKITLDKLAEMTQRGFLDMRKEVKIEIGTLKKDVGTLKKDVETLKEDVETLKEDVGTLKEDMVIFKEEIIDTVREENLKVLQSNDKVVTKLDILLKEHAADKLLHDSHTRRLDRLERKVGI